MRGICNQHNANKLYLTLICSLICSPSAPSPAQSCNGALLPAALLLADTKRAL